MDYRIHLCVLISFIWSVRCLRAQAPGEGQSTVTPLDQTTGREFPGYVLYDGTMICFRAYFNSKIVIRYHTEGIDKTRVLEKEVSPDNSVTNGTCGSNTTVFTLGWADGNYSLTFYFQQTSQPIKTDSLQLRSWSATSIKFVFDAFTSDFPGIVAAGKYTADTVADDVHFTAPANLSYSCTTQEDIPMYVKNADGSTNDSVIVTATLSLWDVRIQAFEVLQTGVFSDSASCKPDLDSNVPEQNIVPLVVAACLAALIAIIIIGYFFVKNKSSTQYSAMQ